MDFVFPYIGNLIIPIDELIFFRGVETTNQILAFMMSQLLDPTITAIPAIVASSTCHFNWYIFWDVSFQVGALVGQNRGASHAADRDAREPGEVTEDGQWARGAQPPDASFWIRGGGITWDGGFSMKTADSCLIVFFKTWRKEESGRNEEAKMDFEHLECDWWLNSLVKNRNQMELPSPQVIVRPWKQLSPNPAGSMSMLVVRMVLVNGLMNVDESLETI